MQLGRHAVPTLPRDKSRRMVAEVRGVATPRPPQKQLGQHAVLPLPKYDYVMTRSRPYPLHPMSAASTVRQRGRDDVSVRGFFPKAPAWISLFVYVHAR